MLNAGLWMVPIFHFRVSGLCGAECGDDGEAGCFPGWVEGGEEAEGEGDEESVGEDAELSGGPCNKKKDIDICWEAGIFAFEL